MKKIGIYGGTFDPIHHGHLILAREACESFGLEKIIFVPAALSPHKMARTPTAPEIRLEMLQAAIKGEPQFVLDSGEIERGGTSYTIDTVREIQQREGKAEYFFLLGDDNVGQLETWHRFEQLRTLVEFVVLDRFNRKENRGVGVSALFFDCRHPGTPMTTEAVAYALRLDLYRVDLSSIVNKYIGETEKNLHRLFEAAESGGAVLFFDEADALFGRRSHVHDSHDRYANIEISHLLERMESHGGLANLVIEMKNALENLETKKGSERYPVLHRHIDISATDIRNRVATSRSIRYLVPPAVEEIIRRGQIYQEQDK